MKPKKPPCGDIQIVVASLSYRKDDRNIRLKCDLPLGHKGKHTSQRAPFALRVKWG